MKQGGKITYQDQFLVLHVDVCSSKISHFNIYRYIPVDFKQRWQLNNSCIYMQKNQPLI